MDNISDKSMLRDCYHVTGKYFPMPENTDEGVDAGPQNTVNQSETQLDRGLVASGGVNGPSIHGEEGRAFSPPDKNSKDSEDEQATFAGQRSEIGVSLKTGQITSSDNHRLVPVSLGGPDNGKKIRARLKYKKTRADAKENRI